MHKQLEFLITLHDLDLLLKGVNDEKEAGFEVKKHKEELLQAREKVMKELKPILLSRYEKLIDRYSTAITTTKCHPRKERHGERNTA